MHNRMLLLCTALVWLGSAHAATVEERYADACASCHDQGLEGAPRKGDTAAWEPRLRQGDAVLLGHVKRGMKAMPPRGLCNDCSDAEYLALIQFMSK